MSTRRLSALRVSARSEREALLWGFAGAIGEAAALAAYGPRWPMRLFPSEHVYAFYDDDLIVGWGSLAPEPSEEAAWVGLGVWPSHRRRGYRREMREWLADEAARLWAVRQVQVGVLATNQEHVARCLRESERGEWIFAGRVWFPPPGFYVFTRLLERRFGVQIHSGVADGAAALTE